MCSSALTAHSQSIGPALTFGAGTGHSLSLLAKKTRALHLKKAARPEWICYALIYSPLEMELPDAREQQGRRNGH